jgi:hypothetical protein
MSPVIWTLLTFGAMLALFLACVVLVVGGVRLLERILARRAERRAA